MPPDRVKLKVGRLSKCSPRRSDKLDHSCREPTSTVVRDCIPIREETWQHFPFSVLLPRVLSTGEGAPYGGQCCPDHLTPIRQSGTAWLTSKVQAHTEKAPRTRNVPVKKQHSLELILAGNPSSPSSPRRAKQARRRPCESRDALANDQFDITIYRPTIQDNAVGAYAQSPSLNRGEGRAPSSRGSGASPRPYRDRSPITNRPLPRSPTRVP
jgi:hypothetical protein